MANTKSAAKRARQTITRTLTNRRVTSKAKTMIKKARAAITEGKKDAAQTAVRTMISTVDKAAKTGQIHKNKANRLKSRTNKALAKLA